MNCSNMEDRLRLIWLLVPVLFQPLLTGADCNFTKKIDVQGRVGRQEYVTNYYAQCVLKSLQTNVPLPIYIPGYSNKYANLRSIDFSSSTINTVPVGVFQPVTSVALLLMDSVYINNIVPGALRGLTQLEELHLNYNNISEIQDGTFDGLVQLTKLNMAGNKLTTLKSLNGLTSLKWLDVQRNNIASIDAGAFKDTVSLENLYLNGNKLAKLNSMLFSTTLQLRTVYLQNNYIDNIPTGLFNITNSLETVDLSNNTIRSVPCSELSGSVRLHLNQITSLVNCSKSISYLDVSYNNLTTLPAMLFKGSPSNISLDLSHNNISSVHADAFEELRHLVTLSMNNNRITSIPLGTFRHLGEVTALDISFNNLTHLEYGFFGGLDSLRVLNLSDNNIAMLESKVLFPLRILTRLNLDGNLLSTFDVDAMISHFGNLKSISLDRNQIRCELLASYLYMLRLGNVKVDTGDSFKTNNVHGIYCVSDNPQRNSTTPTDVSVKVTQPLLPTTKSSGKSVAAVVPTQATPSTTIRIPSTTVFPFTKFPELINMTMKDHNDNDAVDCNKTAAIRAENEQTNEILKNIHSLFVFATVAVIILIIINMAINMYFTKRNNFEIGRKSSSSRAV